jgi:hypothetical protein
MNGMPFGALKTLMERSDAIRGGDDAMEFLIRIIVGVGAAWIVPDPAPQQTHSSGYEARCSDDRCLPLR